MCNGPRASNARNGRRRCDGEASIARYGALCDTTQLESWVQAKLTKAADYLKTVKHYVEYGMEEGAYDQVMPEMDPVDPVGADMDDEMILRMLEKLSNS